jgi:hypothetical protein
MHDEWSNCSSMTYVTERTRQMTHGIHSISPAKPPSVQESNSAILEWRLQAWLLKNSLSKNPQKLDRVRMPYKRFAGVA